MTTLVCPIRPGERNEELRYALRSWETNLAGSHTLVTVGYCPRWLKPDMHVSGNRVESVSLAVWDNVHLVSTWLSQQMLGLEEVLYMNDDFFAMKPVESVPFLCRDMSLDAHIASLPRHGGGWWGHSLRLTAYWLSEAGFPQPTSYEVHRPLLARPEAMSDALSRWDRGYMDGVPQWRTVYGTFMGDLHEPPLAVPDVKIDTAEVDPESEWFSTSDYSWPMVSERIARAFPQPSRWERR